MDGFKVTTYDDEELGTVKRGEGRYLLVQSGLLHHTTRAIPATFAEADPGAGVVRVTISKALFQDSPTIHGDELDVHAVDEYYGLTGTSESPANEGDGDVLLDDPTTTAEQQGIRSGIAPSGARRVATRDHMRPGGPDEHGAGHQIHQDYIKRGE
jgi:hypothetical protein